jgi:predicted phage tail protein
VTPGDASAVLEFFPATVPHYDSITSVSIKLTAGSSTQTLTVSVNDLDARMDGAYEYTLANLTNGTSYVAEVAVNLQNGGLANYVSSPSFIPFKKPDPPTSVEATASDQAITLTWVAPLMTGGLSIDRYNIYKGGVLLDSTEDVEYDALNLDNGTKYSFTVTAVTVDPNVSPVVNIGENESSKSDPIVSSTPFTESDPPTGLKAVAGDTFVTLSWDAPTETGGLPIDHYEVFSVSSGTPSSIGTRISSPFTASSLTNGNEYTFAVKAVTLSINDNSEVSSVLSDSVDVTPTAPPPAVSGFDVIAVPSEYESDNVMSITWTALTSSVYV